VAGRRDGGGEWRRIVIKGVGKVREEIRKGEAPDGDPCELFSDAPAKGAAPKGKGESGSSGRGAGSDTFDYERDDIGNAARLKKAVGTDARWVDSWQTWVVYDPTTSLWDRNAGNSLMMRRAIKVVRQMGHEAAFIEDLESQKAFKSWVKTSGSVNRLDAMLRISRHLGGLSARAEEYDADWSALHVANGTLVLGDNGVTFRGRRHEDMATLCAPVAYDAKATSPLWLKFLREVLPDKETRNWVQKLVGASLVGGNPDRSMVIGIGPTTSGKSTFIEVLASALGAYAQTYNLQMFREKRDEGPRVDLLNALTRRFIHCTEASSDVTLHVDSIKRMTGGDQLSARGMSSNIYVEAIPAFTPWLMTNEPPNVPGADAALRRRLKVAPFLVSLDPDKVDPTLRAKLSHSSQLPGVFAWAAEGWNLYRAEGLDGPGLEVIETTFEVRESLSLLDAWIRAACELGTEYYERTEDLHSAYLMWLEMNREEDKRHSSLSAFGRAMSANNFNKDRRYIDGTQTMCRFGIRLRKLNSK
jgi:P4 family phage/plasmid primase-like protien